MPQDDTVSGGQCAVVSFTCRELRPDERLCAQYKCVCVCVCVCVRARAPRPPARPRVYVLDSIGDAHLVRVQRHSSSCRWRHERGGLVDLYCSVQTDGHDDLHYSVQTGAWWPRLILQCTDGKGGVRGGGELPDYRSCNTCLPQTRV